MTSDNTAWVTLATNDGYAVGALVLAHSLRNVGTSHKLHVLYTSGVSFNLRSFLFFFWKFTWFWRQELFDTKYLKLP